MDVPESSRGLKRGDLLSLYLYILCMEFLSIKIVEKCESGEWEQVKFDTSGTMLSHLFLLMISYFSQGQLKGVVYPLRKFLMSFAEFHVRKLIQRNQGYVFYQI